MRILYVPFYTSLPIDSCPTYAQTKIFLKWVVENNEDVFLYWPIPREDQRRGYPFTELNHPRIKKIEMGIDQQNDQIRGLISDIDGLEAMFGDMAGKYPVDLIYCDAPLLSPQLQPRMSTYWTGAIPPVWVNVYPFVVPPNKYTDMYRRLQVASHLAGDVLVWQTAGSMERAMKVARKYLNASTLVDLKNKSAMSFNTFIDVERIQRAAIPAMEKRRDCWVATYGGGVGVAYNSPKIFGLIDAAYSRGHNVKVLISASGGVACRGDFSELYDKRYSKYFDVTTRLPQDDFWKRESEAHVFLFAGKTAESALSTIELALLNVAGVFLKCPWTKESTYPGYPYIGENDDEMYVLMRYVLEHYFEPDVQEVIEKQKAFVIAKYGNENSPKPLYEALAKLCEERIGRCHTRGVEIRKALRPALEGRNTVTWAEVDGLIQANLQANSSLLENRPARSKMLSFWKAMMEVEGYRDDCQSELPVFVR